jgi:protein-disulfide isomerase
MNLDTDEFNTCLDSGKYTQLVTEQTNIGRSLGVSSTPTFAVNGRRWLVPNHMTFQQTIDGLLAPCCYTFNVQR